MGKYVLYTTVVEPARSAKPFRRENNLYQTGVLLFKSHLLRHFLFFFGGTFCVATVWGCVYRVFRNLRKNARVRRKTKKEKSFILSIFSATAMARDAILTLKCAGHCPLAIGIFSFWIRRLNPEKIEKEQKISRTIYQKTNRIRRSFIDQYHT